jgi:acyl carrier protein
MNTLTKCSEEAAVSLVAQALEMDKSELDENSTMMSVERWDSLSHLRLITLVEETLGRELQTEEILMVGSVQDVAGLLKK